MEYHLLLLLYVLGVEEEFEKLSINSIQNSDFIMEEQAPPSAM